MKEISIIMPVYNVEKYVGKSIESVLKQTYKNFELILIDDGSTDESGHICDKYAMLDSRIRVYHQDNVGLARTVRRGVELARFDYIGFVDSDDYISEYMYEDLVAAIDDADMAECGYAHVDENGNVIKRYCHDDRKGVIERENGKFPFDVVPLINNGFAEYTTRWIRLYKKQIFKNVYSYGVDNVTQGEDFCLTYPIIASCRKIAYVPKVHYFYLQRSSSMAHTCIIDNHSFAFDFDNFFNTCDTLIKSYKELEVDFNEDALCLSMLRQEVLGKIRYTIKDYKERKLAYRMIVDDERMRMLLDKSNRMKMDNVSKIIFFLLRHRLLYTLSRVYN